MLALAAAAVVTWSGCEHRARIRPKSIVVACADANFYVANIRWSQWRTTRAVGVGTAHVNDCKPNCAAGHVHSYPATATFSKPKRCPDGRRDYRRALVTFSSPDRPPGAAGGRGKPGTFVLVCPITP